MADERYQVPWIVRLKFLPADLLVEDYSVCCIFCGESIAFILHAEHHERLQSVVAYRAFSGRSYADYAAFLDREHLSVNLEFAFSAEEEIEFLMSLVGVQEASLGSRLEHLEGEVRSRGAKGRSAEYFSRNLYLGSEFKYIAFQFIQLAYADGCKICSLCKLFFSRRQAVQRLHHQSLGRIRPS